MKTNLFPERDTNSVHSQAHSNTNSTGKFENYKKRSKNEMKIKMTNRFPLKT